MKKAIFNLLLFIARHPLSFIRLFVSGVAGWESFFRMRGPLGIPTALLLTLFVILSLIRADEGHSDNESVRTASIRLGIKLAVNAFVAYGLYPDFIEYSPWVKGLPAIVPFLLVFAIVFAIETWFHSLFHPHVEAVVLVDECVDLSEKKVARLPLPSTRTQVVTVSVKSKDCVSGAVHKPDGKILSVFGKGDTLMTLGPGMHTVRMRGNSSTKPGKRTQIKVAHVAKHNAEPIHHLPMVIPACTPPTTSLPLLATPQDTLAVDSSRDAILHKSPTIATRRKRPRSVVRPTLILNEPVAENAPAQAVGISEP